MTRGTKKLRILVVDDHELVRRGIRGLLRARRGWTIIGEAANGREAVEKANKLKPDVAIVDISMPDLDGLQATRQIREAGPTTKVVVLTMHESDQMVRRVLEAGALGYILKSDLAMHLVNAVNDVSAGKLFLTPRVSDIVLKGFLKTRNQPDQPHARLKLFDFWQREKQIRRLQPSWELLSGRWRRTERKSCSSLACIPSPNSSTMRSATGYSQRQASQNSCRIGDNRSVSPSLSSGRDVQL